MVEILQKDGIIIYPTDTVYGIGCDAANKAAVEKLHQVKGMPKGKQLAFDADAGVLYAATGPQGKLYRITKDKKAQVYLDVEEEHLASVAVGNGKVYAAGFLSGNQTSIVRYQLVVDRGRQSLAALDADRTTRERALSAAKFTIGRIGTMVAEECIQLHGGIGMTWELPLPHYAKRLVMIDHQLGDEDHHLARYIALGREQRQAEPAA